MNLSTHKTIGRRMVSAIFLLMLCSTLAKGQQVDSTRRGGWAIKTNALEWLLTIPNLDLEFDLSKSPYNRSTLGLTAKYNWQTYHKYTPYCAFNLLDIRPEYRHYYRQDPKKKHAKEWRAYYWGIYADYATYAFKFSPEGIKGTAYGLGFSYGYGIQLYQYKKCAVDFELGASVGLVMTEYDRFAHDASGSFYYPTSHRDLHPVPFPVVSELRVAFAIRPVSINDKYRGEDPTKKEFTRLMENIAINFESSTKTNFDYIQDPDQLAAYKADYNLYLADFTAELDRTVEMVLEDIKDSTLPDKYKKKAQAKVQSYRKEILDDFVRQAKTKQ